jgi:transposase-like protein
MANSRRWPAWLVAVQGRWDRRMKGHGAKFARKMEAAIAALLTQRNIDEAAKAVGIAPNTLLSWMKVPEFRAAYLEARHNTYSQATAKLQQGATAAATTLLKVMLDQSTPPSVRVRAAECVLNHSLKAIEIEDVEARVSELERHMDAPNEG